MTVTVPIGNGFELAPDAAASWLRAVAAGCPVTITSAYRSAARQQQMRDEYLAAKAAGRHPTYVAAVKDSEHVTGEALDLKGPAIAWMHAHPEYGFQFTDSTESWHVAYRAARDVHHVDHPVITLPPIIVVPPVTLPNPLTPHPSEDDMITAIQYGFRNLLGKEASVGQVIQYVDAWKGASDDAILDAFLAMTPSSDSVAAAYQDLLGRPPESAAVVAEKLAQFHTIRDLRADIAGSAEAKARR